MTTTNTEGDGWAAFKREFGLDDWPTPACSAPNGATLAPLRAEVARLRPGPRPKQPPVPVADGMKYCWKCQTALPLASFDGDRDKADAKRGACRPCDAEARARRARERRARLKLQPTNGGGLSAIQ